MVLQKDPLIIAKFWLFWTFGEMRVPRAAGPSTETN